MVNEITTIKNYTVGFNSMIYLFDNCYLSTTNNIVETSKQVWIGSHPKLNQDPMLNLTYDILHSYEEIDDEELDELFNEIHQEHSDVKTIIYCDTKNFMYVYSYFFNGILETAAVKELYSYDRLKENYRIGTFTTRDVEFVDLPKTLKGTDTASVFSSLLPSTRIEIAFANLVMGNQEALEFCSNRINEMYDGSPGFWAKYAEQSLPAIMSDSQFTIENLLSDEYRRTYVDQFNANEFLPNKIVPIIKQKFDFDYYDHFFTIINNSEEYQEILDPVLTMTKKEFIETRLLNPEIAIKFQLLFPNYSNFDSVNPIFWNMILKNHNNTVWLDKYKVKNGTYNQTN
jgi:hypothetical protein